MCFPLLTHDFPFTSGIFPPAMFDTGFVIRFSDEGDERFIAKFDSWYLVYFTTTTVGFMVIYV